MLSQPLVDKLPCAICRIATILFDRIWLNKERSGSHEYITENSITKKKGISQEDLANALNVSRQAVSKWESSQSVPDMDKIVALSSYFNITTDYLLKDEIETIDGADNYSSKNVDMQMLNKELSENDFQNIRYEAERKNTLHIGCW